MPGVKRKQHKKETMDVLRSAAASPVRWPRSPSTSPSRKQPECTDCLSLTRHDSVDLDDVTTESHKSRAPNAFYSLCPPAGPVVVLTLGSMLPTPNEDDSYNVKALSSPYIMGDAGYGVWDEEQAWLSPGRLQEPASHANSRSSRARTKVNRSKPSRAAGAVRRVLRELIASLPLFSPQEKKTDTTDQHKPVSNISIPVQVPQEPPAPTATATPPTTCSVSVQAQAQPSGGEEVVLSPCETANPSDGKWHHAIDGWVGGARALRDSHVRLVLRQLRHIERLNRALDHAAIPAEILNKVK